MEIPPDIQIRATIRTGCVYYFSNEDFIYSSDPHYHIVLNKYPKEDPFLILVVSSSQVDKVKARRNKFPNTLVEIDSTRYSSFTRPSIIDCNTIFKKTIDDIVQRLINRQLKRKPTMDESVISEIRAAVMNSPIVENEIKKML